LIASNECGTKTLVKVAVDGKMIYFFGGSAKIAIDEEKVVLMDNLQNTWEKVR
jgi:hypothetical protein